MSVVNVVWVIEQLHGLSSLLALMRSAGGTNQQASSVRSFLQGVDPTAVNCMDDLCHMYEAYRSQQRQLQLQLQHQAPQESTQPHQEQAQTGLKSTLSESANQAINLSGAVADTRETPSRPTKRPKRGEGAT